MINEVSTEGFSIISDVYDNQEIEQILAAINQVDISK